MNSARIVYGGGVEAEECVGGWRLNTANLIFPTIQTLQGELGLRAPVLHKLQGAFHLWLLCNPRSERYFQVDLAELTSQSHGEQLWHVRNLSYHLGAVVYHCTRLGLAYVELCNSISQSTQLQGAGFSDKVFLSSGDEAYYEFDACVTAARRIFDVLSYPLWRYFNSRPGNCPDDLGRVLKLADSMPPDLRVVIEKSWNGWGQSAREYRNSIQHHVPIEFGMGTVPVAKLACGAWSARVLIPDNPEAQSRSKFTFARKVDALEYSRELTSEVCALVTVVLNTIAALPQADRVS